MVINELFVVDRSFMVINYITCHYCSLHLLCVIGMKVDLSSATSSLSPLRIGEGTTGGEVNAESSSSINTVIESR